VSGRVYITGVAELRQALRQMDRRLPKKIAKVGREAAWIVARAARPRVPSGPASGGHAASSIRPILSQSSVGVQEGGSKYPYMPWLDFGGAIHPREHQEIRRSYIHRGRYIWAAFGDNKQAVMDKYQDGLAQVAREAGLDVS
jgi:hypothetical protein